MLESMRVGRRPTDSEPTGVAHAIMVTKILPVMLIEHTEPESISDLAAQTLN
jgi:hypothetical protein